MASNTDYYGVVCAISEMEGRKYLSKKVTLSYLRKISQLGGVDLSPTALDDARKRYNAVPMQAHTANK